MSTLKATNLQHASAASPAIVLAATGSATAQLSSINDGPLSGMRNRIINGDMRIDQRNAGAAVTTNGAYPVDRFFIIEATDGAYNSQQSSTAPSGHSKSLYFTTTTADATLASGQAAYVSHHIEGANCEGLAWGTASAKSVVLSFKVRSSLTGTFGGAVANSARNRSYPFTYSISTADTWTDVSVAIPGDTSGTWLTDTGVGIRLTIGLGVASDLSGTAGAWAGADYRSATSAVSVIGTLNATFYITGVQLEPGSVATPFERRSYGQELALCQRYYQKSYNVDVAPGTLTRVGGNGMVAHATSSYMGFGFVTFQASMRSTPTVTPYNPDTGLTTNPLRNYSASTNGTMTVANIGVFGFSSNADNLSISTNQSAAYQWTASAEL